MNIILIANKIKERTFFYNDERLILNDEQYRAIKSILRKRIVEPRYRQFGHSTICKLIQKQIIETEKDAKTVIVGRTFRIKDFFENNYHNHLVDSSKAKYKSINQMQYDIGIRYDYIICDCINDDEFVKIEHDFPNSKIIGFIGDINEYSKLPKGIEVR